MIALMMDKYSCAALGRLSPGREARSSLLLKAAGIFEQFQEERQAR